MNDEKENYAQKELEELQQVMPFVKSWNQLYAFVLIELLVLIVFFYFFSQTAS